MSDTERLAEIFLVQSLHGGAPERRSVVTPHAQESRSGSDPPELDVHDKQADPTLLATA